MGEIRDRDSTSEQSSQEIDATVVSELTLSEAPSRRREFLHGLGIAGLALTAGTGVAASKASTEPSITFPDGAALVLEKTMGPLQAAVRTKTVHMPEGGWVGISTSPTGEDIIGYSMQRLPAGHFESLLVAVSPLTPGTHTLYATLFRGDKTAEFPGEGPAGYNFTQDEAEIRFD